MADCGDRHSMKAGEAADKRRIIGVSAITVNFHEVLKQPLDEVQRVRTFRMSRELDSLERRRSVLCFTLFHGSLSSVSSRDGCARVGTVPTPANLTAEFP